MLTSVSFDYWQDNAVIPPALEIPPALPSSSSLIGLAARVWEAGQREV